MKGFLSPRAKQHGFIPMAWNQGMIKSMSSGVPQEIPQGHENIGNDSISEQNISTDEMHNLSTATDDLSLMDPSHVDALLENIFSVSNPPVTSTPKTSKDKISQQCNPSTDSMSDVNKQSKAQHDGAANGSSTDAYDETTNEKTQEMSGRDETNKLPRKAQRIPDHRFEEILKGNFSILHKRDLNMIWYISKSSHEQKNVVECVKCLL